MLPTKARLVCLFLLLCLLGNWTVELNSGSLLNPAYTLDAHNDTLNDSDDEAALPGLLTMTVLIGLICSLTLPGLLNLPQRWPPLLQPPQPAN